MFKLKDFYKKLNHMLQIKKKICFIMFTKNKRKIYETKCEKYIK